MYFLIMLGLYFDASFIAATRRLHVVWEGVTR